MVKKKRKNRALKVFAIYWQDASYELQLDAGKKLKPIHAVTLMFEPERGKRHLTGSSEIFADEARRQTTSIPGAIIKKIIRLGKIPHVADLFPND